jgi:hypothetical protein
MADFQTIKMPPEPPTEGANEKLSKPLGQIFLINLESKDSFLVS